eukprot:Opistho-1_new@90316
MSTGKDPISLVPSNFDPHVAVGENKMDDETSRLLGPRRGETQQCAQECRQARKKDRACAGVVHVAIDGFDALMAKQPLVLTPIVHTDGHQAVLIPRLGLALLSEFLGTMILVGVGSSAHQGVVNRDSVVVDATAYALIVMALIYTLNHISSHFNPVVTIAMVLSKRLPKRSGILFIPTQCLGAAAGAGLVKAFIEGSSSYDYGATHLGPGVSVKTGILMEAFMTFNLIMTIFFSSVRADAKTAFAPLPIAAIVWTQTVIGGTITGASLNPARSFGPALVSGNWDDYYVYWVGPLFGSVVATALYHLSRRQSCWR